MAPEILDKSGHTFPIDWWALGTMIYEMIIGVPPFFEEDEDKMYNKILKSKLTFPKNAKISKDCKDII